MGAGAFFPIVAAVGAAALSKPVKDASDFSIFVGRFHPLLVHLPIGALVLVVTLEALTLSPRFRGRLDATLAVALPLAVTFATAAFVFGLLLARAGGYPASAVAWHRGLTLGAIFALGATSIAFGALSNGAGGPLLRHGYRGLLAATMGLLTVGAHFGGNLSRGEDYLTRYAPSPLKKLLHVKEPEAAPAPVSSGDEKLVYQDVVAPILDRTCVSCHGTKEQKGKLRLDSLDAVMKGGQSGPAAIAGNGAASPMIARLLLPESDDDHMPPPNHPAPSAAERDLIAWWIDRGANATLRVADALPPDAARSLLDRGAGPKASTAPSASAPPSTSAEPATSGSAEPGASTAPPTTTSAPPLVVAPPASGGLAFRDVVQPILRARCESCHGSAKQKGKLRLDSFAALSAGGASGPAFVANQSGASALVTRMRLPLAAEDHMPPAKAAQPSDNEIQAIEFWIDHGASETLASDEMPARLRGGEPKPPPAPPPSSTSPPVPPSSASGGGVEPPPSASTPPVPPTAPPIASSSEPPPPHPPRKLPASLHWEADVIVPLLKSKCAPCHVGDSPMANLRVDDASALHAGGYGGPPLVAGDPAASLLFHRVDLPPSDDDHMPPAGSPQMTPAEIALVEAWIEAGATNASFKPADQTEDVRAAIGDVLPPEATTTLPSPVPSAAPSSSASPSGPPEVHGGGCAGCMIGGVDDGALPAAAFVALVLVIAGRRRRE